MQKKSFFKIIFWILAGLMGAMLIGFFLFAIMGKSIDPDFPTFMMVNFTLAIIFVAVILTALALFVYKDASKRGMDPWLWMTIVVFVPNLIGLIIYIIVRKSTLNCENQCVSCGKAVSSEFNLCPYCGAELKVHCPQCGKVVSSEWKLCPHCSAELK